MKNHPLAKFATLGLLTLGSQFVYADADIAVQPVGTALQATANVDLCVVVPQILVFGVGDVGIDVAKLQWTIDSAAGALVGNNTTYSGAAAPFTAPAPFGTTATASVSNDGGTGVAAGNQVDLPVFLFSNSGANVLITSTVSGGTTGGGTVDALDNAITGTSIPISSFTAGTGAVAIPQPALANNSSATATATAGIVNSADTWTYSYTPASIPAAGTYEARVTYVAATP